MTGSLLIRLPTPLCSLRPVCGNRSGSCACLTAECCCVCFKAPQTGFFLGSKRGKIDRVQMWCVSLRICSKPVFSCSITSTLSFLRDIYFSTCFQQNALKDNPRKTCDPHVIPRPFCLRLGGRKNKQTSCCGRWELVYLQK